MPTLIASIAALTVAFVGAVNAIWAIMRDRERLGALERVTALLSGLDSGGYEWEMMRSMQKDLARQVFLTHLRRFMGGGWLRWGRTFAGTAIIPLVAELPFRNVGSVGIILNEYRSSTLLTRTCLLRNSEFNKSEGRDRNGQTQGA